MKTTLILSALVFTLTLAPAAFANGAQEETPVSLADVAVSTAANVTQTAVSALPLASVARSLLERIDVEARENLLNSLRESSLQILQVVAPVLVEAATDTEHRKLSAR